MRILWVALALVVPLAGCSGGEPSASPGGEGDDPTTGSSIAGVVVSPAIVPLANVSLSLAPARLDVTSDGEGRFAFEGLREGPYTLVASLAGFVPSTLVVEAGGPLVKVVLEPDHQVGSYVESYVFDGFLEWSFTAGGARSSNSVSPNYTIGCARPTSSSPRWCGTPRKPWAMRSTSQPSPTTAASPCPTSRAPSGLRRS